MFQFLHDDGACASKHSRVNSKVVLSSDFNSTQSDKGVFDSFQSYVDNLFTPSGSFSV